LKKHFPHVLCVISGIIAGIIISGVLYATTGFSLFGGVRENPAPSSDLSNSELAALAFGVLGHISEGDFKALSQIAHPELGIVFSPCATITLATNKCFQAEQIALFGTDTNLYVWGVYTGSGEPIELTPADYFAGFVFDRDYSAASVIGINYIVRSGNALENITDVLTDIQFVDFYIAGSEKEGSEDNDWSILRLGFEEFEGNLFLTVILRSEWLA